MPLQNTSSAFSSASPPAPVRHRRRPWVATLGTGLGWFALGASLSMAQGLAQADVKTQPTPVATPSRISATADGTAGLEMGRRLSLAERAELREQLRQQWVSPHAVPPTALQSADARPVDRAGAAPSAAGAVILPTTRRP